MAILESVKELASKLGAETNGRDITDQLNKINKHLDETALSGRDIAEAVKTYSENASGGGVSFNATPTTFSLVGNIDNLHVVVPEGVTKIADYAFYITIYMGPTTTCPGLKSIILPSTLTEIGIKSFRNCTGLTEITIPDSVTTIGNGAFAATGLTEITIPDSVTTIGNWILQECPNLASVTFKSTTPPSLSNPLFEDEFPATRVIRVPRGTLTAYTTAQNYPSPDKCIYEEY